MTTVQFIEIKPFTSCCKDLEVSYHIPSSIPSSSRHYIPLCEAEESSQFTWVWAGKTVPLQQEGITVKWREGKVTFASQVLPKLSDGREYYLMYCNEDGTILGESRPFQFVTDSDEFSSIDLHSAPSDDVVMVSMHLKKAPTTSSEVSLHNNDNDTTSFEVISEQRYTDTTEPIAGDKDPEYFSQSVTATVIPKGDNTSQSTASKSSLERYDTKPDDDDDPLTSSYKELRNYQNLPMESSTNKEVLQVTLKDENIRLKGEIAAKDSFIEDLLAEITALKEQVVALNTLSNSTVLINSPKEDKEKRILLKRIQEETKKSARFEELLHHKETRILQLENDKAELIAEVKKAKQHLLDQTEKLQGSPFAEQQNAGPTVKVATNSKLTEDDIANYNTPVGGDYKTKLYLKLFRQDPFICHKCNEILPAHTQEFTRLNHIQQCRGLL